MARDGERGRGDWKARRGSRNSGPYAEASGDTGPVDIAAVRRDDALIDAIASDGPVRTDTAEEYQLATLLASWRAELITPPMTNEPDLDAIVAAVNQEIGARQVRLNSNAGGRLRLLRPIAGTAAALALVFGGLSAFSYNAEPGDPLWRVKEVVFSQQAQTTVVQRADDDMTAVESILSEGSSASPAQVEQAKEKLVRARVNATQVNDPAKQDELASRFNELLTRLQKMAPEVVNAIAPITSTKPADPRPTSVTVTVPVPMTGKPGNETVAPNPGTKPGTTNPGTTPGANPGTTDPAEPTTGPTTAQPPTTVDKPTSVPNHPPTVAPTTVAPTTVVEPTVDTGFAPTQPASQAPGPATLVNPNTLLVPPGVTGPGTTGN